MRTCRVLRFCVAGLACWLFGTAGLAESAAPRQRLLGVNLPGAGFAGQVLPGIHGPHYLWPPASDVDLFAKTGANVLRIAFLWERMQPTLFGDLNAAELERLDAVVGRGAIRGVTIILDVHNYGLFRKKKIGSSEVPVAAFTDLWTRLAAHYRNAPNAAFGLMNEPHEHKAAEWAPIAQEAILAIRKTGARQLILVPGTNWSSAARWLDRDGWTSNADALKTLKDPADNYIFEVHQYFDSNSSGTHPTCVDENIGVKRLSAMTDWLHKTGKEAFLGEFGASKDPVCLKALRNTLAFMNQNGDVWRGWSFWAASPRFGDYMFNIYPPDAARYPQVPILEEAMKTK